MKTPATASLLSRGSKLQREDKLPLGDDHAAESDPLRELFLEISNPVVNHAQLEWSEDHYPYLPRVFRLPPAKPDRTFVALISLTTDQVRIFCYRGSLESLLVKIRRKARSYGIGYVIDAWKHSERHVLVMPRAGQVNLGHSDPHL